MSKDTVVTALQWLAFIRWVSLIGLFILVLMSTPYLIRELKIFADEPERFQT